MIRSFKDSRTERLFHGEEVREFQAFARQADKCLRILDAADTLRAQQMLPSNRLEALKGGPSRAVQHPNRSAMAGVL
jgi:toxin HigB-1